ncbi:unnamed protein product, partial [marine sediment metagenome]
LEELLIEIYEDKLKGKTDEDLKEQHNLFYS